MGNMGYMFEGATQFGHKICEWNLVGKWDVQNMFENSQCTVAKCVECTSSTDPSSFPSSFPSAVPSSLPSSLPSAVPSSLPSAVPSLLPSSLPSAVPSSLPSAVLKSAKGYKTPKSPKSKHVKSTGPKSAK